MTTFCAQSSFLSAGLSNPSTIQVSRNAGNRRHKNALCLTLLACSQFIAVSSQRAASMNANHIRSLRGSDTLGGRSLASANAPDPMSAVLPALKPGRIQEIRQEWQAFDQSGITVITPEALANSKHLLDLITNRLGYQLKDYYLGLLGANGNIRVSRDSSDNIIALALEPTEARIELRRLIECAAQYDRPRRLSDNITQTLAGLRDDAHYIRIMLADNTRAPANFRVCSDAASLSFDGPQAKKIATLLLNFYQYGNNDRNHFQAEMINIALGHGGNYPIHLGAIKGETSGYNVIEDKFRRRGLISGIFMDPDTSSDQLAFTVLHEIAHELHDKHRDTSSLFEGTGLFSNTGDVHSREQVAFMASVLIAAHEKGFTHLQNLDVNDYSADLFLTPRFRPEQDKEVDGQYRSTPPERLEQMIDSLDCFFDILNQLETRYFKDAKSLSGSALDQAYQLYQQITKNNGDTIALSYTNPGNSKNNYTKTYSTQVLLMEHILLAYQHDLFFPNSKVQGRLFNKVKPKITYFDHDPTGAIYLKTGIECFIEKLIDEEGGKRVKKLMEQAAKNLYLGIHHMPFTNQRRDTAFDIKTIITPALAFLLGFCSSKIYQWCYRDKKSRGQGSRQIDNRIASHDSLREQSPSI